MKIFGSIAVVVVVCLATVWLAALWLLREDLSSPNGGRGVVVNRDVVVNQDRTDAKTNRSPTTTAPTTGESPKAADIATEVAPKQHAVSSPVVPATSTSTSLRMPSVAIAIDPFADGGPAPVVVIAQPPPPRSTIAEGERDQIPSGNYK